MYCLDKTDGIHIIYSVWTHWTEILTDGCKLFITCIAINLLNNYQLVKTNDKERGNNTNKDCLF